MFHTVHIALGDNTKHVLCDIREYIIKYGDDNTDSFFHAMLYDDSHEDVSVFYEAVHSRDNADRFVAGIDNLYSVNLEENYRIAADNRDKYLQDFFAQLYNKSVTIDNRGGSDSLHLCFYLPTYHPKYWSILREFIDAIAAIPQKFNVDVLMLSHDLAYIFENDVQSLPLKMAEYQGQSKKTINDILEFNKNNRSIAHAVLLQNYNYQGVSLDLTQESFVRIVGEYALLSLRHYKDIFNPNAQDPERSIHALGLSVLSFDKYYFVQYLLHKAYINILDRENILQEEVDVNKISPIVKRVLDDNVNVFASFYDEKVKKRLERGEDQDAIKPRIYEELLAEIERLTCEFQSFLDDDTLSLPEKKAALAQLLGEDDELFVGYLFDKKQLVLDDCARGMLDLFIEYNNRLVALHSSQSSTDVEKEAIASYAVLSEHDMTSVQLASDSLDEIKAIKVKMMSSSNYIRQKEEELAGTKIQIIEGVESEKRLTKKGFVFEGKTYRLQTDIEERPCSEDYKPKKSTLPASVDLRSKFTTVKDQGEIGACSAFAIVGIFEYILKKNGRPDVDLSESFVYYNARKEANQEDIDEGSSLIGVIESIMKQGVCHEKIWPYSKGFDECPSDEVYNDAQSNKIVKALNVNRNLVDIKSALAEGYPVAISLKIYDSFKATEGFVSRPSQEELDGEEHGNHAMIICGYSDEEKVFVVRNSWGTRFGDQGYCYIPYSYISDVNLLNVACIVTEIADNKIKVGGKVDTTKSLFAAASAKIKALIIRNLIDEERVSLGELRERFINLQSQFTTIFERLGNNLKRDSIYEGTKQRLEMECRNLTEEKEEKQKERIDELDRIDKKIRRNKWCCGIAAAIIALVYIGILAYHVYHGSWSSIIDVLTHNVTYWVFGVCLVFTVIFILWCRKRKLERADIEEDFEKKLHSLASEIAKREKELDELHIKTYVAGIWVDSFYKLSRDLHSKYLGMKSYVGNLKVWRFEEEKSVKIAPMNRAPFLSLISNECLDHYFETQKDNLLHDIKLSAMFKDRYGIEEKQIIDFKNGLKKRLVNSLFSLLDGFSVYKYVVRQAQYPYIDNSYTDVDALLEQMYDKSEVFVRRSSTAMNVEDIKLLFLSVSQQEQRAKWDEMVRQNFRQKPSVYYCSTEYKIPLLRVVGLRPDEVDLLR